MSFWSTKYYVHKDNIIMKLPSLFRKANYQRFHIEPRYYDPVKEDIEEREARIRREVSGDKSAEQYIGRSSRISGSFSKPKSRGGGASATLTQLIIMVMLSCMIMGYLYVGNIALYIFATATLLLVYLKYKQIL